MAAPAGDSSESAWFKSIRGSARDCREDSEGGHAQAAGPQEVEAGDAIAIWVCLVPGDCEHCTPPGRETDEKFPQS